MFIISETKLGFNDVLIVPKRSTLTSRAEVDLYRDFSFKHSSGTWKGIPVIASNMGAVGTFAMAESLAKSSLITAIHKHYTMEQWDEFLKDKDESFYNHFMVTTGIKEDNFEMLKKLFAKYPLIRFICADVANGYTEKFAGFVSRLRDSFPQSIIVAGNVVTGDMTEQLILSGADIVKVGIGSGSVCTTRLKTGVGYPQLSAVIECSDAAHGLGGRVISDGGCTVPGDIAKAFASGGDFVMLGGMLSAHNESGGKIVEVNGEQKMEFYGMSSGYAMDLFDGSVSKYRTSEGKRVLLDAKGPVDLTIQDILGGLRSTCTYVGAIALRELSKRTTFIRVQEQANNVYNRFEVK